MASENEKVKLLGFWVSPFSIRVEWALRLKGVEYEYIEEDIFNKSPRLTELNPVHKKVPVLVHRGRAVAESFVIMEYIDETWKQNPPLLPKDPYDRAMARFWANFTEQLLETGFGAMCYQGDEQEKYVKSAIEAMEKLEGELKGKKFFGGEEIGYLDLAAGWIAYWLPVWEEAGSMKILDPHKFPAISSWRSQFLEHDAVKCRLPPRDEAVVYFRNHPMKLRISAAYSAKHG